MFCQLLRSLAAFEFKQPARAGCLMMNDTAPTVAVRLGDPRAQVQATPQRRRPRLTEWRCDCTIMGLLKNELLSDFSVRGGDDRPAAPASRPAQAATSQPRTQRMGSSRSDSRLLAENARLSILQRAVGEFCRSAWGIDVHWPPAQRRASRAQQWSSASNSAPGRSVVANTIVRSQQQKRMSTRKQLE